MVGKLYPSSFEPLARPRPAGTVPYEALPAAYAELILVMDGVRECIPDRGLVVPCWFVGGGLPESYTNASSESDESGLASTTAATFAANISAFEESTVKYAFKIHTCVGDIGGSGSFLFGWFRLCGRFHGIAAFNTFQSSLQLRRRFIFLCWCKLCGGLAGDFDGHTSLTFKGL